MICLSNDVIWWIPFALYLRDAGPTFKLSLSTDTERCQRSVDQTIMCAAHTAVVSDQTKGRAA